MPRTGATRKWIKAMFGKKAVPVIRFDVSIRKKMRKAWLARGCKQEEADKVWQERVMDAYLAHAERDHKWKKNRMAC